MSFPYSECMWEWTSGPNKISLEMRVPCVDCCYVHGVPAIYVCTPPLLTVQCTPLRLHVGNVPWHGMAWM